MFDKYGTLEVNYWSPYFYKYDSSIFFKGSHPDIDYRKINITGNRNEDIKNLKEIEREVMRIKNDNDTTSGVHIIFADSSKTWAYVKVIEICYVVKIKNCITYENDIWIWDFPYLKKEYIKPKIRIE